MNRPFNPLVPPPKQPHQLVQNGFVPALPEFALSTSPSQSPAPAARPEVSDRPIVLHLARSGLRIAVDTETSILEALLMAGIDVASSCQQGVCGTCETRVVAGTPEHRDMILSDAERAANNIMMICCSRALSAELTLDL
jgi:tetrachlorobenzoquinone reductase